MPLDRNAQYPFHLARLVQERLAAEYGESVSLGVLDNMLETLYFASLKTDEGHPTLCTVSYLDPAQASGPKGSATADHWMAARFERQLPWGVRTLTKLSRAADPHVSSLAAFADEHEQLFLWGMVDQEPRPSDHLPLDGGGPRPRPGLIQVSVNGVGNIAVYKNDRLLGSLSQNSLVEDRHDVLWAGPLHETLADHLRSYVAEECRALVPDPESEDYRYLESELMLRWLNSICHLLINMQHYRHGGGLLIVPQASMVGMNVTYRIEYRRLVKALVGLIWTQRAINQASGDGHDMAARPAALGGLKSGDITSVQQILDEHRNEVLNAVRFIASLSRVDGIVLLDRHLTVHGFGVELRGEHQLSNIHVAGDCQASDEHLRQADLTFFGTRHRALMRYCYDHPGSLGFAVSQDGDIRAMTRIDGKLIVWENIDVRPAVAAGHKLISGQNVSAILRLLDAGAA